MFLRCLRCLCFEYWEKGKTIRISYLVAAEHAYMPSSAALACVPYSPACFVTLPMLVASKRCPVKRAEVSFPLGLTLVVLAGPSVPGKRPRTDLSLTPGHGPPHHSGGCMLDKPTWASALSHLSMQLMCSATGLLGLWFMFVDLFYSHLNSIDIGALSTVCPAATLVLEIVTVPPV